MPQLPAHVALHHKQAKGLIYGEPCWVTDWSIDLITIVDRFKRCWTLFDGFMGWLLIMLFSVVDRVFTVMSHTA